MTEEIQEIKTLVKELKLDLTKRMDELDAKVDKAADFQTVFLGAIKILTALVILGAGIATIYVALHGSGGPK